MSRSAWLIAGSLVGLVTTLVLELFGITHAAVSSVEIFSTAILLTGILIPVLEVGFHNITIPLDKGFKDSIVPTLNIGFSNMTETIKGLELSPEIRDLADYLSREVRYIDHTRTIELEEQGHITITYDYTIKNISNKSLSALTLPPVGQDIGDHREENELDELIHLLIDEKPVGYTLDVIRTQVMSGGSNLPYVQSSYKVENVYRIPVALSPGHTVHISLKSHYKYCVGHMYESDAIGARIHDITEKLTVKVKSPAGHKIMLDYKAEYPKGIMVVHLISTNENNEDEMVRVSEPIQLSDTELYWQVDKPIIGYGYAIRFRVENHKPEEERTQ